MDKQRKIPWVTFGIGIALAVFYSVWLTHSYTWSFTPWDAVVGTVLTGLVPLTTLYVLARIASWMLRKPFLEWSTEEE